MTASSSEPVDPFRVTVREDEIENLRARLANTRWPDQLPGAGWDYGANRQYIQDLCAAWRHRYDWKAFEERCNAFDQYETVVDGERIHFYHVQSPEPDARPLLLIHGWPSTVAEFFEVLGPLSNPAVYGGDPADAFHLVVPSLPGYGFSGSTRTRGVSIHRTADMFVEMMDRLGYDRFFSHGGDWGAVLTGNLGDRYPDRVDAIQMTKLIMTPPDWEDPTEGFDDTEHATYQAYQDHYATEAAYIQMNSTKPQTLGYGLNDSPAGLAAWVIEKYHGWSDTNHHIDEMFSREQLLDTLSIFWLTETINSANRMYYETLQGGETGQAMPENVTVLTGLTRYLGERYHIPKPWTGEIYTNVVDRTEFKTGGHFPAMEVPERFVEDVRRFFRKFR